MAEIEKELPPPPLASPSKHSAQLPSPPCSHRFSSQSISNLSEQQVHNRHRQSILALQDSPFGAIEWEAPRNPAKRTLLSRIRRLGADKLDWKWPLPSESYGRAATASAPTEGTVLPSYHSRSSSSAAAAPKLDDAAARADTATSAASTVVSHPPSTAPAPGPSAPEPEHKTVRSRLAALSAPHALTSLRVRFDRLLPPGGRYPPFSLTRRAFLLCVALPMLLLLFLAVPLAVGLAVGLRNHRSAARAPLPAEVGALRTGDLTYFLPGLGACGEWHGDADAVVAVSRALYDAHDVDGNPNNNPLCGRSVLVTRDFVEGGKGQVSVEAVVADRCPECADWDLDLSPAVFNRLALEEDGRVVGHWQFLD